MIPYEIENVRIRYYAENSASGYAKGLDIRLNGEFVKGMESWASLSIMKTAADIENDYYKDDNGTIVKSATMQDLLINELIFPYFFKTTYLKCHILKCI